MKHRNMQKRTPWLLLLLLCLSPLAGGAQEGEQVAVRERHVYEVDGVWQTIPQEGAEQLHHVSIGETLRLTWREFPGFVPQGGALVGDERLLDVREGGEVLLRYDRGTLTPVAQVRVATDEASALAFLEESLSGLRVSLRRDWETLETLPVVFEEGILQAEIGFAPVYSHTPEGQRTAYRVMAEDLPAGFVSEASGLELLLRPIQVWVTVTHVYETGDGVAPIPQRDAEYILECRYGDSLLIPNRDFEGFAADVDKPNLYLESVAGDQRVTFYHRRRVGVYGQLVIEAGGSSRPQALPGLIQEDPQVELILGEQVQQRSTAFFSGERLTASISFPQAPTHTPEGRFIDYQLTLSQVPEGFDAASQGLTLTLTPVELALPVQHRYEERPGVWAAIPQQGSEYALSATYGDEVFVEDRDFLGFLPDPMGDRYLSALDAEEPVRFTHERSTQRVDAEIQLLGSSQTNVDQLTRELSGAYLLLRGGELPESGLRLLVSLSGGGDAIRVQGSLEGLYTHAPDGTLYRYAAELHDFAPLSLTVADIEPGTPGVLSADLPEREVRFALRYVEGDQEAAIPQEEGEWRQLAHYGDQLQITPPELPGFVALEQGQVVIPYLTENENHVFRYARQTGGAVSVALEWQEQEAQDARPQEVQLRLLRGNSAGQEEYQLLLETGPDRGYSQQTAFAAPHTHDLRGMPYDQEELLVELGEAPYDVMVESLPEGYRVSLWPYGQDENPVPSPTLEAAPSPQPTEEETEEPLETPEPTPQPEKPSTEPSASVEPSPSPTPQKTPAPTQQPAATASPAPAATESASPVASAQNPPPTAVPAQPEAPAPTQAPPVAE